MFSRLMGSPFSSKPRSCRLRALYRKQYLTPTMILDAVVLLGETKCLIGCASNTSRPGSDTHHRLVNTTPKPSATKNSNGLLPPVPPSPESGLFVPAGSAGGDSVDWEAEARVLEVIEATADDRAVPSELVGEIDVGVGSAADVVSGAWRA